MERISIIGGVFIMAGPFENWLVVSDIDGTLNTKTRKLPQNNVDSIERFVDGGGHFTLASGRCVSSLERHYKRVSCNAPAVVLNGAGVYDFEQKKMIVRNEIDSYGHSLVETILDKYPLIEVGIFFDDYVYVVRAGVISLGQMTFERVKHEVCSIRDVPPQGWCKVVFWSNPLAISQLEKLVRDNDGFGMNFMKSSPWSYEMLQGGYHKGTAAMKIAGLLGIEKEHVAAIGDYYNDWDLLCCVGFPACAGQAPQEIHDICRFEACHCNDGCVSDLLEHIMRTQTMNSGRDIPVSV